MKLKEKIEVETDATIFELSKHREVIVIVEPSGTLGFRLKGTKRTYELTAQACYHSAVKAEVNSNGKGKR